VAKPEWGVKRTCLSCGARFYDLQREPIVCPACGAIVDATVQSKPRRARATPAIKVAPVPAAAVVELEATVVEDEADVDTGLEEEEEVEENEEVAESEAAEDESEEEGESAIEDVSELGDDDMTDVIDTEIDEEETDR
jgi:uncharacterized protein (TIGR02300 family)